MDDMEWRIDITDADIRVARLAWQAARDAGDDPADVARLRQMLEGLWRLQAQQIVLEFRQRRNA